MLALSAAYNMWPVLPAKWVLRRFNHSAIYLLIAGTYTPFLAQMKNVLASAGLGSRSRYEIRRGKGSMSIVGDIGLALGVLLFAFGMVGLVTRIW
jgi:hypothetical protein